MALNKRQQKAIELVKDGMEVAEALVKAYPGLTLSKARQSRVWSFLRNNDVYSALECGPVRTQQRPRKLAKNVFCPLSAAGRASKSTPAPEPSVSERLRRLLQGEKFTLSEWTALLGDVKATAPATHFSDHWLLSNALADEEQCMGTCTAPEHPQFDIPTEWKDASDLETERREEAYDAWMAIRHEYWRYRNNCQRIAAASGTPDQSLIDSREWVAAGKPEGPTVAPQFPLAPPPAALPTEPGRCEQHGLVICSPCGWRG